MRERVRRRWAKGEVGIAFLTVAGLVLRSWRLGFQSLWRDEADAIRFAMQPWPDLLHMFTSGGDNGPLYFLLLRGWIALFGASEVSVRALSVAPGVLLVPLVWAIGRRLGGPLAGAAAAALAAVSPYLVWYSQEAKMYSWVALLVTLSFYGLWRGLEEGRARWWALHVAAMTGALWMHILAALAIPAGLGVWLATSRRSRKATKGFLISLAALTLPYVALARWQVQAFVAAFRTGHARVPLPEMVASLFVGWSGGVLPWLPALALLPAMFFLLAVWSLTPAERRPGVAALTIWMGAPVALLFLVSLRTPLFTERYLAYAAPAFYLLLGVGVAETAARWRWAAAALIAVALVMAGRGVWAQGSRPIKPDWRGAAGFVRERSATGDALVFLIPHGRVVFEYYCPCGYAAIDAPYTNGGALPEVVAASLEQATKGHRAVWLLLSEADLWDGRGLVAAWFRDGWSIDEPAAFQKVEAVRFVR